MVGKGHLLATTGTAALLLLAPVANAKTIVGTIYGAYDSQCGVGGFDCSFGTGYPVSSNTSNPYDTPNLFIVNSGSNALTSLSVSLAGYQADNNGKTASFTVPDIAPHTVFRLSWNNSSQFSGFSGSTALARYDYDDEYGRTNFTYAGCNAIGAGLCADVGNFDVSITGDLSGNPISSDFSPDNTQDGGNQQGAFVGWEGLDPLGFSETTYDVHTGTAPGVLAYIYSGTNGSQTSVPEPATLSLFGAGLGALAVARRRRKRA